MTNIEGTYKRPSNFSTWHRTLDARCYTTDIDGIFCDSSPNMNYPKVFESKETNLTITSELINQKERESYSQIKRIFTAIKDTTEFFLLIHKPDMSHNMVKNLRTGEISEFNEKQLRVFFENRIHNLGISGFNGE